ncbi:MAG: hypothetical protein Q8P86_02375 [bacterium]|nr:hypothetical protein [bacterium]
MKTKVLPVLGNQVAENCSLFVDVRLLLKQAFANMELVFYPEDGSQDASAETKGKGAFQFSDQTPLVWSCTFGEFQQVVDSFGFKPYKDDKLAFQNPLMAVAFAQFITA